MGAVRDLDADELKDISRVVLVVWVRALQQERAELTEQLTEARARIAELERDQARGDA